MLDNLTAALTGRNVTRFKWGYVAVGIAATLIPIVITPSAAVVSVASVIVVLSLALFGLSLLYGESGTGDFGIIIGGGTAPTNLLVESHEATNTLGKTETLTWPSFQERRIDRALYRSALAFVVHPVQTEEEVLPPRQLTVGKGGIQLFALAGHADFAETRRLMSQKKGEIAEALENLQDQGIPFGAVHILSTGFSNSAFFAESDAQHVASKRQYNVVFHIDGPGRAREHLPEIAEAIKCGMDKFPEPEKVFIIATNNESYDTPRHEWEDPMRVMLMLTGAFMGATTGKGSRKDDILQFPSAGMVFAPLQPRKVRASGQQAVEQLRTLRWPSMWTYLDPGVPWAERRGVALLMAGRRADAARFQSNVERQLRVSNVRWALAPIPGAESLWVCPLVPLVKKEVVGTTVMDRPELSTVASLTFGKYFT
jgi:hypothetical protein